MSLIPVKNDDNRLEFNTQGLVSNPESCTLNDSDIDQLRTRGSFPPNTVFKAFDPSCPPDLSSDKWICFPEYPFTIGLKFPFPPLITEFFATTKLCYVQAMPMIWRTLSVIQTVVDFHVVDLGLPELAQTYHLRSHGSNYFLFKVKPNRSHLVLRTKQNDPNWKSRFFFVDRNSLPNCDQVPSSWLLKADFAALALPDLNTEGKLRAFLEISEDERTFKCLNPSESAGSLESQTSMSASYISLLDIDNDSSEEKSTPPAAKSKMPNLRSKSSKKRKADDVPDPANLDSEFAKIIKSFEQATENLSKCYNEKASAYNDMRKLSLVRKNAHDKDAAELVKLKKEVKDLKAYILKMSAESDAKTEEITQELTTKIKRDAAVAIFEARMKMVAEASNKGLDTSFWPVDTWATKLAKAKGESPEVRATPASKVPKAAETSSANQEDADMNTLASVSEVLQGLSGAGEPNTLGKEGK